MKWLLFASLLLVSLIGKAQSTSATQALRGYTFYGSPLLYVNLADTATRHTIASPLIPPGGDAYVVKRFNSRWYIVSISPEGTAPYYYLRRNSFKESTPLKPSSPDSAWH
jgi:hypothetical protein